jgi:hypothetical protein
MYEVTLKYQNWFYLEKTISNYSGIENGGRVSTA